MAPTQPITLYRMAVSGHCHRVELMLSLLGLPFALAEVNLLKGEHQRAEHLALNALGQVPVIVDGGTVLSDSWMPQYPVGQARLQRWFSLAAGLLAPGVAAPRFAAIIGRPVSEAAQAIGQRLLDFMEGELQGRPWLLDGEAPSLADVAMVSYISQAPIGGLPLSAHPRVAAWVARMEALPGYVPLADRLPEAADAVAA